MQVLIGCLVHRADMGVPAKRVCQSACILVLCNLPPTVQRHAFLLPVGSVEPDGENKLKSSKPHLFKGAYFQNSNFQNLTLSECASFQTSNFSNLNCSKAQAFKISFVQRRIFSKLKFPKPQFVRMCIFPNLKLPKPQLFKGRRTGRREQTQISKTSFDQRHIF